MQAKISWRNKITNVEKEKVVWWTNPSLRYAFNVDSDTDDSETSVSSTPPKVRWTKRYGNDGYEEEDKKSIDNRCDGHSGDNNKIERIEISGNPDAFEHFFAQDPLPEADQDSKIHDLYPFVEEALQRLKTYYILHSYLHCFQSSS